MIKRNSPRGTSCELRARRTYPPAWPVHNTRRHSNCHIERELKETHHRAADPRVGIVARARRDLRPALVFEPARLVRLPAAPADDGAVHPHVTPAVVFRVGQCGAVVVALFGRIL